MLKLAIGENLLIMQTSLVPTTPWGWRLIYLPTTTTVASASGITEDYQIVALSSSSYSAYEGKTLLLEVLNDEGTVIETDYLTISGPYGKFESVKLIAGLFGENAKRVSSDDDDYQDGHLKHEDITLYTDNTLLTALATFDWEKDYVEDYTPDARYQTQHIKCSRET